jgi:hypothetical protein
MESNIEAKTDSIISTVNHPDNQFRNDKKQFFQHFFKLSGNIKMHLLKLFLNLLIIMKSQKPEKLTFESLGFLLVTAIIFLEIQRKSSNSYIITETVIISEYLIQSFYISYSESSIDLLTFTIISTVIHLKTSKTSSKLYILLGYLSLLLLSSKSYIIIFLNTTILYLFHSSLKSPGQLSKILNLNESSSSISMVSTHSLITEKLLLSTEILKNMDSSQQTSELKSNLKMIQKLLKENSDIYATRLEEITKDLDFEDKIFIEQTTLGIRNHEVSLSSPVRLMNIDAGIQVETDKLQGFLKKIGKNWDFNTLFVADCSKNNSLFTCGEYVFKYLNFLSHFRIPLKVLRNFLQFTESRYLNNPYHNSCHAADVMNSFLYLINPVISEVPSTELLACVISCLGHDLMHPGKNNRFLIQTKDNLAFVYNDISVLENMHAREVFSILKEDNKNIVAFVEDFAFLRKIIVELILSTDMAKHFEFIAWMNMLNKTQEQLLSSSVERLSVYKIMIKCADVSHTSKVLDLHKKWSSLLIEEFFAQGDEEKKLGLPVSMYCDRITTDISKSQSGFLKNIALPLYLGLYKSLGFHEFHLECVNQLNNNISYWEKRRDSRKFLTGPKRNDSMRTYTFTNNNDEKYKFDTKRKAFIRSFE